MYTCLIVRPSVGTSVHPPVNQSVGRLVGHPSICLSLFQSISYMKSVSKSICPSVCQSVSQCVSRTVRQSVLHSQPVSPSVIQWVKNYSSSTVLPEVPHHAVCLMHGTSSNRNVSPKNHAEILTPLEKSVCLLLLYLMFHRWANCLLPKGGFDPKVWKYQIQPGISFGWVIHLL